MQKRLLPILILLLLAAGCSVVEKDPPPSAAWLDHFDIEQSGWNTFGDESVAVSYDMEGLRFSILEPDRMYWSTLDFWYQDVEVTVDAAKIAGSDSNMIGLICRYQDDDNFYVAVISSDQTYAMFRRKDGEKLETISTALWVYHEDIRGGNAVNQLTLSCEENILTFSVNGHVMDYSVVDDFEAGKVGVLVKSGVDGGVDVVFDQFTSRMLTDD